MKYHQWTKEWLELYVRPSVKEKTYLNYSVTIKNHIVPELGDYELEELTLSVLQSYILKLGKSGNLRTGGGLSASTVGTIVSIIQRSLRFAVEIGIVDNQNSDHIKRPKINSKKVDSFSISEQRRIEDYILRYPASKATGVLICLYTGMRIGELMALRWGDVDFENAVISVNGTCRDGFINGRLIKIIDTPKTESSKREIPIPVQLLPYLIELKRKAVGEYVISNHGNIISVRGYQKSFSALLKRLDIDHKSFHSLRHTFATRALECGMDVKTLADILGHKNPNITLNRYAHSMIEHKIAMMNRVGRLLQ